MRRCPTRANKPSELSGLAGAFFVTKAADATASLSVADVAPYAAFGAIYIAISAAILFSKRR